MIEILGFDINIVYLKILFPIILILAIGFFFSVSLGHEQGGFFERWAKGVLLFVSGILLVLLAFVMIAAVGAFGYGVMLAIQYLYIN